MDKCTSSAENDACMRRSLKAPRKCILPHTAAALQPNRTPLRMMGPNCAAGLVLVLSVDTVLQFDTEHSSSEVHEQCIGHGAGRGHRGRRKVWLTVQADPTCPHIPCASLPTPSCHTHDNMVVTIKTTQGKCDLSSMLIAEPFQAYLQYSISYFSMPFLWWLQSWPR